MAQKDPIQQLERLMLAKGFATPDDEDRIHSRPHPRGSRPRPGLGRASPFPDPSDLLKGVYEEI